MSTSTDQNSRRGFLRRLGRCGAGLTVTSFLPFVRYLPATIATRSAQEEEHILVRKLTDTLRHPTSARVVGRAYLYAGPETTTRSLLIRRILGEDANERKVFHTMNRDRRRERLRTQIRNEFQAGKIVTVNGWILAETEACLCSLAALHDSPPL